MNIRLVRKKIKSVGNVSKITRAMQLVSAVKMKKALTAAIDARPYQETLEKMIIKIGKKIDIKLSPFLNYQNQSDRELFILVTTNKGLCGAFNANLLRHLVSQASIKGADFITVGRKGAEFVGRLGGHLSADFSDKNAMVSVSAVVDLAAKNFLEGKYKSITVYYNRFISALRTEPTSDTLFPVIPPKDDQEALEDKEEYLIEPVAEEIINVLLKNYIEEKLRYIFLQNEAGEHSARMLAMKNATDNANDLVFNLTLVRNKLRQQKITYELLDMITAKESVEAN